MIDRAELEVRIKYSRVVSDATPIADWIDAQIAAAVAAAVASLSAGAMQPVKRELTDAECDALRRAMWDSIGNADNSNKAIRNWYAGLQEQSK